MQVSAKLKYARISPQKCRLVADLVRGKPVGLALNTLLFTPKKGARLVHKVLESAVANAENNLSADVDELKVQSITVDEAPTKNFPAFLYTDHVVREFLRKRLVEASISRIQIERAARKVNITIHTARPGIVIGKKGEDIEKLRGQVSKMMKMPGSDVRINIAEIRKPELDALLVAEGIAQQLERRVMFRRAMKRAVTNTMRIGALGIKVRVSGRLNGAEIARTEVYREGRVPLHTFRADIDYGLSQARTTYGVIGVKVWIFKGEVFQQPEQPPAPAEGAEGQAPTAPAEAPASA